MYSEAVCPEAGILLSNSVLRAVHAELDWCVRNSYSAHHHENIGRCVLHAARRACADRAQGVVYSSLAGGAGGAGGAAPGGLARARRHGARRAQRARPVRAARGRRAPPAAGRARRRRRRPRRAAPRRAQPSAALPQQHLAARPARRPRPGAAAARLAVSRYQHLYLPLAHTTRICYQKFKKSAPF
ncbi:hypothetical protein HF086_005944 [Spodoptera exigua]|uniref:Hexosyltransferase n=1 Tax=Spodoptera exigua TaxID=7107 RepID=A0A922MVK1_SPOEX|nr:hypothetical protein HF086_005944 [Spodoptera exigua]